MQGLDPHITRRQFLATLGSIAAGDAVPALGKEGGEGLHVYAAAHAKALSRSGGSELRLLLPEGSEENLRPVVDAFLEATGIRVELLAVAVDDISAQLSLEAMSGESRHDVALPATFALPDLVTSGAIRSLSAYAAMHEPSNYRDGLLYGIGDRFDGELYGYQTDGDVYLMFYLQELLEKPEEKARYADQHGEALAVPETWQQLDRQMAFFNRPGEGLSGGLLFRTPGYLAWEWWARFHAKGIWPFSPRLVPQIAGDEGVEALEEMIRATASLAPETRTLGLFDNWKRYAKGDVYCNIGWGGSQKYLNGEASAVRGRLSYRPTPGGQVQGELMRIPYFNWGWNYVVTTGCRQPEMAYLFALFASTPEISTASVREAGGYFDPFRAEHYEDNEIRRIYSDEFLEVHRESLAQAIPDLYLESQGQYFGALSDWLDRAMAGKVSPDVALQRVAQQWEQISSRAGRESQIERWAALRSRYPVEVAALLRDLQ